MRTIDTLRNLCRSRRGDCLGMMAAGTVFAALGLGDPRPEAVGFVATGAVLLVVGAAATGLALGARGAGR